MEIAVFGIDLGKTVCSVAGVDGTGAVVMRKRVQRFRLLEFLARLAPCVVAMETCGGTHHIGRFCLQFGHEPRLISPLSVRPYVKPHKNDDRDAEGIAKAATRPTMSFVPITSEEQLDLQALHRYHRWAANRRIRRLRPVGPRHMEPTLVSESQPQYLAWSVHCVVHSRHRLVLGQPAPKKLSGQTTVDEVDD
jgi:hypothetical protein